MSNYHIDDYLHECETDYNKPCHTISDLKQRNTKVKGDKFELFCCRYMKYCYSVKMKHVWLLSQIPEPVLVNIGLKRYDLGIDVVCQDEHGSFYAIQVKYRNRTSNNKKIVIGWKALSTFYALVMRVGTEYEGQFRSSFKKHIVFTSADYVRHVRKTKMDETISYGKLKKMSHFDWINLNNDRDDESRVCEKKVLTGSEIREKRLKYLNITY